MEKEEVIFQQQQAKATTFLIKHYLVRIIKNVKVSYIQHVKNINPHVKNFDISKHYLA